jgi:hypothetical protein
MPRFKARDVLELVIQAGAASRDFFGIANRKTDSKFESFALGGGSVISDDTLVLIETAVVALGNILEVDEIDDNLSGSVHVYVPSDPNSSSRFSISIPEFSVTDGWSVAHSTPGPGETGSASPRRWRSSPISSIAATSSKRRICREQVNALRGIGPMNNNALPQPGMCEMLSMRDIVLRVSVYRP